MSIIAEKALDALKRGSLHDDGNETRPFPREVLTSKKGGLPAKIYSKLFREEIWLVATKEEMEALASKEVREAVYMTWEIPVLRGVGQEKLKAIHQIKKIFLGAGLA